MAIFMAWWHQNPETEQAVQRSGGGQRVQSQHRPGSADAVRRKCCQLPCQ